MTPVDKHGEPAFTRRGDEDCPECRTPVGTAHLDGCSGQFHESAVGTPYPSDPAGQGAEMNRAEIYLAHASDQIRAAVAHGDGATAERVVDQMDADGFQDAAAALGDGLTRTSVADQLTEQ